MNGPRVNAFREGYLGERIPLTGDAPVVGGLTSFSLCEPARDGCKRVLGSVTQISPAEKVVHPVCDAPLRRIGTGLPVAATGLVAIVAGREFTTSGINN